MSIEIRALPYPSNVTIVDKATMDVSDFSRGALFARVLDPDVQPFLLRLAWSNQPDSVLDAIVEHYETYGAGTPGQLREFNFLPVGGTWEAGDEFPVSWAGPPSILKTSAGYGQAAGLLEINRATVLAQPDKTGGIKDHLDRVFIQSGGAGLTFTLSSSTGTFPVAP